MERLRINGKLTIPLNEIELLPIRAKGPGGQNVNKVSSAVHLRFDVRASSLPERYRVKLLRLRDQRISSDCLINIKAQTFRTREKNRKDALSRLAELIRSVTVVEKRRIPTTPSRGAVKRRLDDKARRGRLKRLRAGAPE